MERPLQIFCCYAREDQPFLLMLKRHLSTIQRAGLIALQADIDVSPSEEWEPKISHYLNTAQMILLLISADFLNSDYCNARSASASPPTITIYGLPASLAAVVGCSLVTATKTLSSPARLLLRELSSLPNSID